MAPVQHLTCPGKVYDACKDIAHHFGALQEYCGQIVTISVNR